MPEKLPQKQNNQLSDMQANEIMEQLETLGSESIRNILANHGAKGKILGVKVEDLKKIQKKVKKDYELSKELYSTAVSDAMYLAGLIADERKMTKEDLGNWAKNATWHQISEYTVAWIAAESDHGWDLAMEWIDSDDEQIASSGWSTLSSLVSIKDNQDLDITALRNLLKRVVKEIQQAKNRVRYCMNGFIIAVGSYVPELTEDALAAGEQIGKVSVNVGNTACKVPFPPDYINKVKDRGALGKKRKMARC